MSTGVLYRRRGNFHQVPEAPVPDRPFLNRDDVAAIGGVEPKTISQHLYESQVEIGADKRDGKFADDPFPIPDGRAGRAPWWYLERRDEIASWFERHPRRRKGDGIGGRPRKAD
ncbi:hypothetical protein [Catenuloplanes indicus]|uniref:Uncharacterized protein n=1 Tax=Catenuloplanes indicus TaxID=137267 RepID=A0AAE4AWP5_9ACTN|nr:hypothetical protein [Catenuloplanes indicus]MDQ0363408.1 hypothetical protein [Catenuloplanes indicus]